ncbi:nucleotidyltransferase family protein [Chondrinema litorale]|uniref:nucleotidyltransferase family protein n=1 Tax=Chondrinema litorale TaxID=2994555 RepID=UPI002543CF1E|nr:NDP-sugar synthase [Chondrinema litorale]UZR94339.1 NDP-sugar synthase [Chondrinema litorale]
MKVILLISNRLASPYLHKHMTPVALMKCGGKYLMEYLLSEILSLSERPIEEVIFVTSSAVSKYHAPLKQIATKFGLKTNIFTSLQDTTPLSALHAASDSLKGEILVVPSNVWFKSDINLDNLNDNVCFVRKITDPSEHTVAKVELNNTITGFFEKPPEFVSDLSPVGICYFNKAEEIPEILQYLMDNQIKEGITYDLNDVIIELQKKGEKFLPGVVDDLISCESHSDFLQVHKNIIGYFKSHQNIADSANIVNTVIISPVYIGENVVISNSVIGPNVSVEENSTIENAIIENSLVAEKSLVKNVRLVSSILNCHSTYEGRERTISLGEYSYIKE